MAAPDPTALNLLEGFAKLIQAGSTSALALVALVVVLLAFLALYLFRKDSAQIRLTVFFCVLATGIVFGVAFFLKDYPVTATVSPTATPNAAPTAMPTATVGLIMTAPSSSPAQEVTYQVGAPYLTLKAGRGKADEGETYLVVPVTAKNLTPEEKTLGGNLIDGVNFSLTSGGFRFKVDGIVDGIAGFAKGDDYYGGQIQLWLMSNCT